MNQGLREGSASVGPGHALWIYHEKDAKKLYDVSLKLVGLWNNELERCQLEMVLEIPLQNRMTGHMQLSICKVN